MYTVWSPEILLLHVMLAVMVLLLVVMLLVVMLLVVTHGYRVAWHGHGIVVGVAIPK